jgi:hypothetical protein
MLGSDWHSSGATTVTGGALSGGGQSEGARVGDFGRRWAGCSCAHGGKDGAPFPVDRKTCDRKILVLDEDVRKAPLGQNDTLSALRRLSDLAGA